MAAYSKYIPQAIEFDRIENKEMTYMILTYLPGVDAEVGLQDMTADEQYSAGVLAGKELKKLHQLAAPLTYPSWYTVKKEKSDKYLAKLREIDIDRNIEEMLDSYIKSNENLMKGRPNAFQHDDFHPANLLINNRTFSGIIDFQRMDWGDPVHDLHKLGFFSKPVSTAFTKGNIDGYHDNQVPKQIVL